MAGKSRSLGSLLVNVGADTRALETGLKSATSSVNEFGTRTAQTTRKARAGFNNISSAAVGVGASMAAATGLGGLMALGPAAAGGVVMRGMNALTSPFENSLRNQMRKLRLDQREMRLQFMGGPAGELFSDINYLTNFSNLRREATVGFFEYFGGTRSRNVFQDLGNMFSRGSGNETLMGLKSWSAYGGWGPRFGEPIDKTNQDPDLNSMARWNEKHSLSFEDVENSRNFGVSP